MPQVTKPTIISILLIAGLMFITACGSSNPNSNSLFDADAGHPEDWVPAGHMAAAQIDQTVCTECHGSNYLGGISGVSCTACHLGGPVRIHPQDWIDPQIWRRHGSYADSNGTTACANAACHGASLSGVEKSGPSCTSCHIGGVDSFHPTSWGTTSTSVDLLHADYVNGSGSTACANIACHGANLEGVTESGPACSSCHTSGSYPFTTTGCVSCHGKPPTGTVAPNRTGAHASHNALAHVTNVCDTCHNGAGAGTTLHDDGVTDVAVLSDYNAKTGTAVRNANGSCSNISCHGGETPVWLTGTIAVNTQCTECHSFGTAQYNGYSSGRHELHVSSEVLCIDCHDTQLLVVNHFTSLNTTTMEGPASATINASVDYNGVSCTPVCHDTRNWTP